jgi:hypothetical protein
MVIVLAAEPWHKHVQHEFLWGWEELNLIFRFFKVNFSPGQKLKKDGLFMTSDRRATSTTGSFLLSTEALSHILCLAAVAYDRLVIGLNLAIVRIIQVRKRTPHRRAYREFTVLVSKRVVAKGSLERRRDTTTRLFC